MRQHWISTEQEQRMDVLGELKPSTKHIWIGLHGYGQLVEFFQRTFRDLATEDRAFVFPQAPHKFYINGVSGRVGASWMTKDERLKDIENQKKYLTTVINWAHAKAPSTPIHVLAFSQGVATIIRFLGHSPVRISTLLAWAGSWPPDASEENVKALSKINFHYHAEHHLWPWISYQYLPEINARIWKGQEGEQSLFINGNLVVVGDTYAAGIKDVIRGK